MKKYIIAGIIIIIAIALLYPGSYDNSKYEKAIDSLNVEIQIKEDSIKVAQVKIDTLEHRVEVAETKLEENQGKVRKIYETYEIQIQSVDSYDIDQLEQFFSDRYKDTASTE
jgi:predicted  nucleic acid-binding Zn-ribbon protein